AALPIHREIARRPDRWQADIAGEDSVLRGVVADRLGDLLRVDRSLPGRPDSEIVERLARLRVMALRSSEMPTIALLVDERQQRRERRSDIAGDPKIDRDTTPYVLGPDIDLRNADARPFGIKLSIGEVGPEHEQHIAVAHRVVARREADQTGHTDVVGIVPFDVLL